MASKWDNTTAEQFCHTFLRLDSRAAAAAFCVASVFARVQQLLRLESHVRGRCLAAGTLDSTAGRCLNPTQTRVCSKYITLVTITL
eukprot:1829816-Heterocapsa_arctica.AAC.1